MKKLLPSSPTPRNVADAYYLLVVDEALALAGRDGRISAREASRSPYVADAHRRTGRSRPVVSSVLEAARAAMLAEATRVCGKDGRVSGADAATMAPPFAAAFEALRGLQRREDEAQKLAAALESAAAGITFMSESDYPYRGFWVEVDGGEPLELEALRTILPWQLAPADRPDHAAPASFEIELHADDAFWIHESERIPEQAAVHGRIDRLMRAFVPSTIRGPAGDVTARIFTATLPEDGHPLAPYFVFGRLPDGDVVGLATFRVWT